MSDTVLCALISAAVTLAVSLLANHAGTEKSRALIEYRLGELTRHVEKHNMVIERTYALEREMAILKEELKKC